MRIAQIRHEPSDFSHAAIFARVLIFTHFTNGETHRRSQFFKVLSNFVNCDATLLCRVPTQLQSGLDLFPEDSFQSIWQRFTQFQFETHRLIYLLIGQSNVAVTFFPSHFSSKPGKRFEFSAAGAIGEFHLGHHETGMSPLININLND